MGSQRDALYAFDEICSASGSTSTDIDDFLEGCLWIKRPLAAVDVLTVDAGARLALHDLEGVNDLLRGKLERLRSSNATRARILSSLEPTPVNQKDKNAKKS